MSLRSNYCVRRGVIALREAVFNQSQFEQVLRLVEVQEHVLHDFGRLDVLSGHLIVSHCLVFFYVHQLKIRVDRDYERSIERAEGP